MKAPEMKAAMLAKTPMVGVSMMFSSPQLVEMIAALGFDWVLFDCEHGSIDLSNLEVMAIAAKAAGITAIARPPSNSPIDIMRVMDRGVDGVQVPHIKSQKEAKAAVESVKFHPLGNRGLAMGTRPSNYGIGVELDQYSETSNLDSIVVLQIEDREAIENLEEILSVADVDVFFVGPSDLSQSLGHPGKANEPPVSTAIRKIFRSIAEAGLISGTASSEKQMGKAKKEGCCYLYTHLNNVLKLGAENYL
jgi:4-hydroxy-2-oxoheptanedioate aldolase